MTDRNNNNKFKKEKELLGSLSLIDDKYISEADPKTARRGREAKRKVYFRILALAATLCAIAILSTSILAVRLTKEPIPDSLVTDCPHHPWSYQYPTTGLISADADQLKMSAPSLKFELSDFPTSQIYKEEDLLAYASSVTAGYTLTNTLSSSRVSKLFLPLGYAPSYVTGLDSETDNEKFVLKINGESATAKLRHTFFSPDSGTFSEEELINAARSIPDTYIEDDFFSPQKAVTKYTYNVSCPEYDKHDKILAVTHWRNAPDESRFLQIGSRKVSVDKNDKGHTKISVNTKDGSEFCFYVAGKQPLTPLTWECFDPSDTETKLSCEITLVSSEIISFEELVLSNRDESSQISDIDWYNASLEYSRSRSNDNKNRFVLPLGDDENFLSYILRWHEYDVEIEANEALTAELTMPIYPSICTYYEPYVYRFEYMAGLIGRFGGNDKEGTGITLEIDTPYQLVGGDFKLFDKTDDGYEISLDSIPKENVGFELCIIKDPDGTYESETNFLDLIRDNAIWIILLLSIAAFLASLVMIFIMTKKIKQLGGWRLI